MLWVIFGHVYLVGMITGVFNMIDHFQVGFLLSLLLKVL